MSSAILAANFPTLVPPNFCTIHFVEGSMLFWCKFGGVGGDEKDDAESWDAGVEGPVRGGGGVMGGVSSAGWSAMTTLRKGMPQCGYWKETPQGWRTDLYVGREQSDSGVIVTRVTRNCLAWIGRRRLYQWISDIEHSDKVHGCTLIITLNMCLRGF